MAQPWELKKSLKTFSKFIFPLTCNRFSNEVVASIKKRARSALDGANLLLFSVRVELKRKASLLLRKIKSGIINKKRETVT